MWCVLGDGDQSLLVLFMYEAVDVTVCCVLGDGDQSLLVLFMYEAVDVTVFWVTEIRVCWCCSCSRQLMSLCVVFRVTEIRVC